MFTLPISTAKEIGNRVAAQLIEWGEPIESLSVMDDGAKLAFGFEVIREEPKWRKTVEAKTLGCKPTEVHDQMNAWRERAREQVLAGVHGPTITAALRTFGREAVLKALERVNHG